MVRNYQDGDHLFIGRIYHEAIHRLACRDYTAEQLSAWAGTKGDHGDWSRNWKARCERKRPWVNVLDGRVVGFIELDQDGYIDCAFVDPDHAGQGVMDEIMAEVKSEALRLGLSKLFAQVSITARKFFERQGFVWVRDNVAVIHGIGLANFIMEWKVVRESPVSPCRPSISIRRADVADSAEIAALLHQLGYPTEERCVRDRLGLLFVSHTDAVFVAECDGAVAGFLAFHVIPLFHASGGLGRITALSVGSDFQRRGVGRELVAAAESFGWHSGCRRIEVTSGDGRAGAHAFYQAAGYRENSRRFIKSSPEAGPGRYRAIAMAAISKDTKLDRSPG